MNLGVLTEVVDGLVGCDPSGLADPESIVELRRQMDRLEAVAARATAAFDASGEWRADGARSAATWLAVTCRRPRGEVSRDVRAGRVLRHLPVAEAAWLTGDINSAHVRLLAVVRRPATRDRLVADEAMLVDHAKTLGFAEFDRLLAYWEQHADPDGTDIDAYRQRDARRVQLSQSLGGMWFGDLRLDPLSGAGFSAELTRLERRLFEQDWAAARDRLGRVPTVEELGRTPGQRRADALVEMAARSAAAAAVGRRPRPLFTVLVDYDTLAGRVCELSDGTVIAPAAVLPWLDEALVERVVFDSPSRVLDVGIARRLFTGTTRRAVEVRDRFCYHGFCDLPSEACEVDHVIPWSQDGPTVQTNGRLACDHHNRNRPPDNDVHRDTDIL